MKIAVAFEPKAFARIQEEAADRGASISEHVAWLVNRCWTLEHERALRDAEEKKLLQALHERERRR